MKVLVTGATGFIGSHLIEQLLSDGYQVRALMRRTSSTRNFPRAVQEAEGKGFEKFVGDLGNEESLRGAVSGVDSVIHLAGVVSGRSRSEFFQHNVEGTRNLLKACESERLKGPFVFVSSLAAAGPSESIAPRVESEEERPVSFYGESKLAAELEVLRFQDRLDVRVVRPPVVYGPRDRGVLLFVKNVNQRMVPVLKASNVEGQKYYSLIHVSDLCRGIGSLLKHQGLNSGEVFYLAGDEIVSFGKVIEVISEKLDRKPLRFPVHRPTVRALAEVCSFVERFRKKPLPLNRDKVKELLPDYWVCSNQKARDLLGFEPKIPFSKGMEETIHWYREKRWI